MSVDVYKVDDVVDRILHTLVGQAGPDDNLDREVRWDLNAAQVAAINEVNPHAFRQLFSITTTDGTDTYDLPDDFHAIIEDTVRFSASDFRTLKEIPLQMYHRAQMDANESEGDPEWYHILGKSKVNSAWRIFFAPTPDTSSRVIVGNYRSLPEAVWNSTRGSGQLMDRRFPPEFIPLLVSGTIAVGHFSRYLNAIDLAYHAKTWAEGLAAFKRNNNPVVGKAYSRLPYPPRHIPIPGGVYPAWWGGQVTAAAP